MTVDTTVTRTIHSPTSHLLTFKKSTNHKQSSQFIALLRYFTPTGMSSRYDAHDSYTPRRNNSRSHNRPETASSSAARALNYNGGRIDRYVSLDSFRPPSNNDSRHYPSSYDRYAPEVRRGRSNSPGRQRSRIRSPKRERSRNSPRRQRSRIRSPRRERSHNSPRRQRSRIRSSRRNWSRSSRRNRSRSPRRNRSRSPRRYRSHNRSRPPRRERSRSQSSSRRRPSGRGIKRRDSTSANEAAVQVPATHLLPPRPQQQERSTISQGRGIAIAEPTRGRISCTKSLGGHNHREGAQARGDLSLSRDRTHSFELGSLPSFRNSIQLFDLSVAPGITRSLPPVVAPTAPLIGVPTAPRSNFTRTRSPPWVPISNPRSGALTAPHHPLQRNLKITLGPGYHYRHYKTIADRYGGATMIRVGHDRSHGFVHFRTNADATNCIKNREDSLWSSIPVIEGQDDRAPGILFGM